MSKTKLNLKNLPVDKIGNIEVDMSGIKIAVAKENKEAWEMSRNYDLPKHIRNKWDEKLYILNGKYYYDKVVHLSIDTVLRKKITVFDYIQKKRDNWVMQLFLGAKNIPQYHDYYEEVGKFQGELYFRHHTGDDRWLEGLRTVKSPFGEWKGYSTKNGLTLKFEEDNIKLPINILALQGISSFTMDELSNALYENLI